MESSAAIGLVALALFVGAAIFIVRGTLVMRDARGKLAQLDQQIVQAGRELEDRRSIRDRAAALARETGDTLADVTKQLAAAEEEVNALRATPRTRIHPLSRRVEPGWPIYRAVVTASAGFEGEAGEPAAAATGGPQERVFAGPAPDEPAFREALAHRFPEADGFVIGEVLLFLPPDSGNATQSGRDVA